MAISDLIGSLDKTKDYTELNKKMVKYYIVFLIYIKDIIEVQ